MPTPRRIFTNLAAGLVALLTLIGAGRADAEIIGQLETPKDSAAGVGSVQGWVYTNTPGATLIQPFDVYVNGVKIMSVPCCSERGDVHAALADAPLRTGFSGTTNWAREAGRGPVDVEVVVRDTAGGRTVLRSSNVDIHATSSMPFAMGAGWTRWDEALVYPETATSASPPMPSWCSLANSPLDGNAELVCMGLTSRGRGGLVETCDGGVRYTWDRATQGFRQTSSCQAVEPWIDHEDGTTTDTRTGLMWEVLTETDNIYHYAWSADGRALPNGDAFFDKVGTANGAVGVCKAGYCDWRVPTLDELLTILDPRDCGGPLDPCTTIPGHTAPGEYWSVTSSAASTVKAWIVDFGDANIDAVAKTALRRVRLVRGAMPAMMQIPLRNDPRRRVLDSPIPEILIVERRELE